MASAEDVGAGAPGPRVVLVDDHWIIREGVRSRLRDSEFEVIAEAGSGKEAIEIAETRRPDVVLLDLGLPDLPGAVVCSAILDKAPETAVIILSGFSDEASVTAAVDAGARAYLVKDAEDVDLVAAIRRVLAGESVLDPRAAAIVLRRLASRDAVLTEQETKILELVAAGLTNAQIGARLDLSPHTVKEYLSNAMRKLGVSNRLQAVLEASRRGLIAAERPTGSRPGRR